MEHRHIIAILRGITPAEVLGVCSALIEEGIGRIEIPLNSPDALSSVGSAAATYGASAEIGAGTVLTLDDVRKVAEIGGSFVVSPDANEEVIKETIALGLRSYPGVFTPSEAFRAIRAGATGLKFFPAEAIGPKGIKAMKAVLPPDVPLYAVGGADPDNFSDYVAAGCTGFGLGTFLYRPGSTAADVRKRARAAVTAYDSSKAR